MFDFVNLLIRLKLRLVYRVVLFLGSALLFRQVLSSRFVFLLGPLLLVEHFLSLFDESIFNFPFDLFVFLTCQQSRQMLLFTTGFNFNYLAHQDFVAI